MADISFILARPWASITVAVCAELGTFVTLVIGYYFGLTPGQAAAVGSIGGADGPMVLFASLIMAKDLFVPISIIAYLYLSLCYAGYPYLVRWLVPAKYRGLEVEIEFPEVSSQAKFVFTIVAAALLCLLLPVASPLILSFFMGVAIKEAEIEPYVQLLENTIVYGSTLFLGLVLGVLCEASTLLDPALRSCWSSASPRWRSPPWAASVAAGSSGSCPRASTTRRPVLPACPACPPPPRSRSAAPSRRAPTP